MFKVMGKIVAGVGPTVPIFGDFAISVSVESLHEESVLSPLPFGRVCFLKQDWIVFDGQPLALGVLLTHGGNQAIPIDVARTIFVCPIIVVIVGWRCIGETPQVWT